MATSNFTGWLAGAQALRSLNEKVKTEHREREINKLIGKEKETKKEGTPNQPF